MFSVDLLIFEILLQTKLHFPYFVLVLSFFLYSLTYLISSLFFLCFAWLLLLLLIFKLVSFWRLSQKTEVFKTDFSFRQHSKSPLTKGYLSTRTAEIKKILELEKNCFLQMRNYFLYCPLNFNNFVWQFSKFCNQTFLNINLLCRCNSLYSLFLLNFVFEHYYPV